MTVENGICERVRESREKRVAVFIDLDGTLIDSIPALFRNYQEFLKNRGRVGTKEEFKTINGPSLPEIISYLKEAHGLQESVSELTCAYNRCLEANYRDAVAPREDAFETLAELNHRRYRLSLVTSTHGHLVRSILTRLDWYHFFDRLITGDSVERAKPAPDIYLLATSLAGTAASDSIAVEDSPNGILAAAKAGCIPIGLSAESSADSLRDAGAHFVISALNQLPDLLDAISPNTNDPVVE